MLKFRARTGRGRHGVLPRSQHCLGLIVPSEQSVHPATQAYLWLMASVFTELKAPLRRDCGFLSLCPRALSQVLVSEVLG